MQKQDAKHTETMISHLQALLCSAKNDESFAIKKLDTINSDLTLANEKIKSLHVKKQKACVKLHWAKDYRNKLEDILHGVESMSKN